MSNNIIILDQKITRWTETREREVTRIEEYEVERQQTLIDIRIPLADLMLLASCGDGTKSTTIAMEGAGHRLRKKLNDAGYTAKRYIGYDDLV